MDVYSHIVYSIWESVILILLCVVLAVLSQFHFYMKLSEGLSAHVCISCSFRLSDGLNSDYYP